MDNKKKVSKRGMMKIKINWLAVFSTIGTVVAIGVGVIALDTGINSSKFLKEGQAILEKSMLNLGNELQSTRYDLKITSYRKDLLTKYMFVKDYRNEFLYKYGIKYGLIQESASYSVTESGHNLLKELKVYNHLEDIYIDQSGISTQDLVIQILSEDFLARQLECYNEKLLEKEEKIIPLEAIIAAIMVCHEERNN